MVSTGLGRPKLECRLIAAAGKLLPIGEALVETPATGKLQMLALEFVRSVGTSMRASLLLAENEFGGDTVRLARSMFEAAVTLHHLDSDRNEVDDYLDFRWVMQHKFHEHLQEHAPTQIEHIDAATLAQSQREFSRVRSRFTDSKGRVRNQWNRKSLRAMAEGIGAAPMYGGIYPLASSLIHSDIQGLALGEGPSDKRTECAPESSLVIVGTDISTMSYAMTLTAANTICEAAFEDSISAAFNKFTSARSGQAS